MPSFFITESFASPPASPGQENAGACKWPRIANIRRAAHNIYNGRDKHPDSVHVVPARNGTIMPFGRFNAVMFTRLRGKANTMWSHHEIAGVGVGMPGHLIYRANMSKGQSGSPVWLRCTNGQRSLVGMHVAPERFISASMQQETIPDNIGAHPSRVVVDLVRTWMPMGDRP